MYRGRVLLLESHEVAISGWFEMYSFHSRYAILRIPNHTYWLFVTNEKENAAG